MEDHRVHSTLEKLQHVCEEKVQKIDRLKLSIKEKDQQIEDLRNQQSSMFAAATVSLAAAEVQQKLASIHYKIDDEEVALEAMRGLYQDNSTEIETMTASLEELICTSNRSMHELEFHHNLLQDVYNSCKEQVLMLFEENCTYLWEINNQQACESLADELAIAELQRRLHEIQQVKREVEKQIVQRASSYV